MTLSENRTMQRNGSARWVGDLKQGKGTVRLGSGAFEGQYSFGTRFENGVGTNPEELIASAHAGCFSMALSGALSAAGHVPQAIATTAIVDLNKVEAGFGITGIHLETVVTAPGLTAEMLATISDGAKKNCPVSRALAAVPITLKATLG
jgi:osmotically inducible protein OsmC